VSPFAPRVNMLGKQNLLNICLPIYYTGGALKPSTLRRWVFIPIFGEGMLRNSMLGIPF